MLYNVKSIGYPVWTEQVEAASQEEAIFKALPSHLWELDTVQNPRPRKGWQEFRLRERTNHPRPSHYQIYVQPA